MTQSLTVQVSSLWTDGFETDPTPLVRGGEAGFVRDMFDNSLAAGGCIGVRIRDGDQCVIVRPRKDRSVST